MSVFHAGSALGGSAQSMPQTETAPVDPANANGAYHTAKKAAPVVPAKANGVQSPKAANAKASPKSPEVTPGGGSVAFLCSDTR